MSQLVGLIRTMRPKQWVKNGFIFIPLLFDHKLFSIPFRFGPDLFNWPYLLITSAGFILLSLVTSAVYIINDLADIEADRAHPAKQNRPLASGQLSTGLAIGTAIVLPLVVLPIAFQLDPKFMGVLAVYLGIQIAYSFWLKHIVLIDVMIIAAGFLLRVAGGTFLIVAERFSPWLYLFTTMLMLFVGFGKRRHELTLLQDDARNHRAILDDYNIPLLDEMIVITTATSVLTYALYTFSAEGLPENHSMMLTIPFVLYGVFRYLYLIHVKGEGGAPDEIALRDRPIQISVGLWAITVAAVLYVIR